MKKGIILIVFTLLLPFNISVTADTSTIPDFCSIPFEDRTLEDGNDYEVCASYHIKIDYVEGAEVYEGEFVTTEGTYTRIEYDHELERWKGVIKITDYEVVDNSLKSATWINLKFSRDLIALHKIELEYTSEQECENFGIFGICIGGIYESELFHEVIINEITDGAFFENFLIHNDDIIEYTSNQSSSLFSPGDYDYTIFLHEIPLERLIENVRFIDLEYTLTDEEVVQLGLDIQDQYAFEVALIKDSSTLTVDEKIEDLQVLNAEYNSLPDLEFGMRFAQYCPEEDSSCIIITEDISGEETTPEEVLENMPIWAQDLIDIIGRVLLYLLSGIFGVSIVGVIGYMIVKKGVEVTGNASIETVKAVSRSGAWWGSQIGLGILEIFKVLGKGIKAILRIK